MNKLTRRIRNGIAYLGLAYFVNCGSTIFLHPYSDFDTPSELVNSDIKVLQETMDNRKSFLEDYNPYFSEKGISLLEEEIANMQVQLNRMAVRKDSLRIHEDEVVLRRIVKPWTYLTDRL